MKHCIGNRLANVLLAALVIFGGWKILSLVYPPFIVPPISAVLAKTAAIATSGELLYAVYLTSLRLLAGLAIGIALGVALGLLLGSFPRLNAISRPLVGLMQAIPPVSWLVLALIWFGFGGRASVFIVVVATMPTMIVSVIEGMANVDRRLLEMADIYRFPRARRFRHVVLPSVMPYFRSGLRIVIGIGSKTVVMGEVLSSGSGIGGEITTARLNIEPESVIAWTVIIVVMYYALDRLASLLARRRGYGKTNAEDSRSAKTFW